MRSNPWILLLLAIMLVVLPGCEITEDYFKDGYKKQFKMTGIVQEVSPEDYKAGNVKVMCYIKFKEGEANRGVAITKDTKIYKIIEPDGSEWSDREMISWEDIQPQQKFETWSYFVSDHLVASYEINILE